jgi:hypothetical protein
MQDTYFLILAICVTLITITAFAILVNLHLRYKNSGIESSEIDQLSNSPIKTSLKKWIEDIEKGKAIIKNSEHSTSYKAREAQLIRFYENTLHQHDYSLFVKIVDKKLNNYATRLSIEYPNLTHKEIIFAILILLNIPNEDIRIILDYSKASLPTLKYRLSKKLGIENSNNIQNFLYDLL